MCMWKGNIYGIESISVVCNGCVQFAVGALAPQPTLKVFKLFSTFGWDP